MGLCSSTNSVSEKNSTLTQTDIELIEKSWEKVVQGGLSRYGTSMMVRLFTKHQNLKPLWRFAVGLDSEAQMRSDSKLIAHGEKLFNSIDLAVNSLHDLNRLVPILIQLGYVHFKYGIRDEHFAFVGAVLIETLEKGLGGQEFNSKVREAWIKVFGIVESQMKVGLRQCEADSRKNSN